MKELHDAEDAVWKALAHPTRRRILDVLVDAPRTTGEIVAELELDRHVVMSHLAVLREADLVLTHKQGRLRTNHLNAVPIQAIHHRWVTPSSGPWASALIAVRDAAEAAQDEGTDSAPDTRRRASG